MAGLIETPEAANRLARAIASDISLYNEEKIKKGIEDDTFFQIIAEEIEEGREHFKSRVAPVLQTRGIFERALCDVIVARKGHIKSRIW
jgi:spore germination protein GerM